MFLRPPGFKEHQIADVRRALFRSFPSCELPGCRPWQVHSESILVKSSGQCRAVDRFMRVCTQSIARALPLLVLIHQAGSAFEVRNRFNGFCGRLNLNRFSRCLFMLVFVLRAAFARFDVRFFVMRVGVMNTSSLRATVKGKQ